MWCTSAYIMYRRLQTAGENAMAQGIRRMRNWGTGRAVAAARPAAPPASLTVCLPTSRGPVAHAGLADLPIPSFPGGAAKEAPRLFPVVGAVVTEVMPGRKG